MTIITYILYLKVSIWITFWVGYSLYKNGRYFLVEAFNNEELADAINRLLLIGFYLVNIAYMLPITNIAQIIETVCSKVGMIVFVLAVMHFFNLSAFTFVRWYRTQRVQHPFFEKIIKILS